MGAKLRDDEYIGWHCELGAIYLEQRRSGPRTILRLATSNMIYYEERHTDPRPRGGLSGRELAALWDEDRAEMASLGRWLLAHSAHHIATQDGCTGACRHTPEEREGWLGE